MNRRDFLTGLGMGAAVTALGGWPGRAGAQDAPKGGVVLKLGSQAGRIPGNTLREKVLRLEEWGGVGIELGGSANVQEVRDAIQGTKVKVSAMCWGSCNGDLVSLDAERRKKGVESMKKALATAGEIESTGVIFVPCFHKQSELKPEELDKVMMDMLPEIAEAAKACGTRVLIEPLNKGETFYINRLDQAVAFCNKINHPGLAMMGDFYHMSKEETDQTQAFVTAGKWLYHVHLATGKSRILPAQEEHSYVEGFKGLKKIGYPFYCSFECGIKKGTDPMVEIPKAMRFLEQQWKDAVI